MKTIIKQGLLVSMLIFSNVMLFGQELYTENSAVSTVNESNSLGSLSSSHGNPTVSISNESDTGSYSFFLENTNNQTYARHGLDIAVQSGVDIRVIIKFKTENEAGTGYGNGFVWIEEGIPTNTWAPSSQTGWQIFDEVVTPNASSIKLTFGTTQTATTIDKIWVDEVSVMTVDNQVPTSPTLSSVAQTDTTVDLSWTAATDNIAVTGYKVYKDAVLETTLGSVLTYQVTGLTAATAYNFTVTALDAAGNESVVSNTMAITTNSTSNNIFLEGNAANLNNDADSIGSCTGVGVDITSEGNGDGTFKIRATANTTGTGRLVFYFPASTTGPHELRWTASESTGADGRTAQGRNSDGFGTYVSFTPNPAPSFNTTPTEYVSTLTNLDGTGFSVEFFMYSMTVGDYIDIDNISIIPITDSEAPSAPTLSSTLQTDTMAGLSWTTATDNIAVTGYKVYKDAVLETTLGNVLSYQVTGLTAATAYNFTVTALDAAGNESVVSNSVSVNTDTVSGGVLVSSQIASSYADAEENLNDNSIDISSSDLELFNEPSFNQEIGLHFANLSIPAGANISNAYIQFTVDEVTTGVVSLNIYAEASNTPQIWSSTNGDITSRTKTTAFVQWSPPDWNTVDENEIAQQTPNLSAIIQEVVNRSGYTSSDAINIIVSGNSGGRRTARSYDGSSTQSPKLFVTYNTSGDTQSPTAPTLSSTLQTDTTVDLSWTAATDNVAVTGYKVYKDAVLETTLGNVLSYQVTRLTAATAYNFTVTALDTAGNESVASNTLPITTNVSSGGGSGNWTLNNQDVYYNTGNVGIGTETPDEKLAVNGNIHAKEIRVDLNDWPDYVFTKEYDLPTLKQVAEYIKSNGHLPNIPSAKEVEESGIQLGEMNAKLLEKIEELTLYTLQLQKLIDNQSKRIKHIQQKQKNRQ
ncbi:fibronectin type III domain-containing protein [Flavivirga spongiicola]|uniref:Fibronectin type III domain-containing protein n=1 Tax=Flavivirga spongiicola TaxID=421621 RepID=A0ABU7XM07_9FLAO|nr:fibronectin type III domain-containing protein [Flavivirga sp. MEBiC05379]MDO5981445.1 fibronectin type III domain-containing protein [Flavivirga sp. MEBiC05379]